MGRQRRLPACLPGSGEQTLGVGSCGGHTHGRVLSSFSPCCNSISLVVTTKNIWVCAKSFHSCLTLYDPVDCSPPGSSIHGILQAKLLEWIAIPFTRGIFLTQGSNPSLSHFRQIVSSLSHEGNITKYPLCVFMCVCVCTKLPSSASHYQKEIPYLPCFSRTAFLFLYFG